jgi:hypothetical protein
MEEEIKDILEWDEYRYRHCESQESRSKQSTTCGGNVFKRGVDGEGV